MTTAALRKPPAPTEFAEHVMVAHYLRARRMLFTHPGNGEKRSVITGARLRRMGLSPGCPDFLCFTPPPGKAFVGAALEMKRRTGTKSSITVEQRDWLDALKTQGWATHVAFGADDAIAWLESLYGKTP